MGFASPEPDPAHSTPGSLGLSHLSSQRYSGSLKGLFHSWCRTMACDARGS